MTAVLDFFLSVFLLFLVLEAPNMKLTVLEDYLELGKTLEIWYKSRNKLLLFLGPKSENPRQQSQNPCQIC